MALEKHSEAIQLYSEALQIQMGSSTKMYVLHERALATSKIGHFQESIDDCTIILKIMPTNVSALLLRAECYEHLEKYDLCARDYQFALCATQANGSTKVQSKLENIINVMKHKLAEDKLSIGNEYFDKGNYHLAKQFYSEATKLWPENTIFGKKLHKAMFRLGDIAGALMALKRMVENDTVLKRMVFCNLILGNYKMAEKNLRKLNEWENIETKLESLIKLRNFEIQVIQCFRHRNFRSAGTLIKLHLN